MCDLVSLESEMILYFFKKSIFSEEEEKKWKMVEICEANAGEYVMLTAI
jgi:hypothetical protein